MTSAAALLDVAMGATNIGQIIKRWLVTAPISQAGLARQLGLLPQVLNDMCGNRRPFPDDRVYLLPDGPRQEIGEIKLRQILASAERMRRDAGIKCSAIHFELVYRQSGDGNEQSPTQIGERLETGRSGSISRRAPETVLPPCRRLQGENEPATLSVPEPGAMREAENA